MDSLVAQLSDHAVRFGDRMGTTFSKLTLRDYIRLVIILGAYALLRPYLIKLGARFQKSDHEREIDTDALLAEERKKHPRTLQDQVDIPDDTDSDEDDNTATGTNWGKKARRRQRRVIRTLLEEDAKRKEAEEAESDKEIEDLLVE